MNCVFRKHEKNLNLDDTRGGGMRSTLGTMAGSEEIYVSVCISVYKGSKLIQIFQITQS